MMDKNGSSWAHAKQFMGSLKNCYEVFAFGLRYRKFNITQYLIKIIKYREFFEFNKEETKKNKKDISILR